MDADLPSVAILTTGPNQRMKRIHHRMPVVLPRATKRRSQ